MAQNNVTTQFTNVVLAQEDSNARVTTQFTNVVLAQEDSNARVTDFFVNVFIVDLPPINIQPDTITSQEAFGTPSVGASLVGAPSKSGVFSRDVIIQGIEHDINPGRQWLVRFYLSSAEVGGQPWILGDSTYGVLDSTTRLGW